MSAVYMELLHIAQNFGSKTLADCCPKTFIENIGRLVALHSK